MSQLSLADMPAIDMTGGIPSNTLVRIIRGDWDAVDDLIRMYADLRAERDRLKLLTESLAERVWAQSELLAKRAERVADPLPGGHPVAEGGG